MSRNLRQPCQHAFIDVDWYTQRSVRAAPLLGERDDDNTRLSQEEPADGVWFHVQPLGDLGNGQMAFFN
jgi:hypothetical protein